jgi:hypothetical protein
MMPSDSGLYHVRTTAEGALPHQAKTGIAAVPGLCQMFPQAQPCPCGTGALAGVFALWTSEVHFTPNNFSAMLIAGGSMLLNE